jgi:hypothetical protein
VRRAGRPTAEPGAVARPGTAQRRRLIIERDNSAAQRSNCGRRALASASLSWAVRCRCPRSRFARAECGQGERSATASA